jgi:hypothetical protein
MGNFCLGWLGTLILVSLSPKVAGITNMSHHAQCDPYTLQPHLVNVFLDYKEISNQRTGTDSQYSLRTSGWSGGNI